MHTAAASAVRVAERKQVLYLDHATGLGGILHNDPLVMRNDTNPIMDAPLNSALR